MTTTSVQGSGLRKLLAVANATPLLSQSDEAMLARRARDGDQRAFARLLESHIRLVVKIAREFGRYDVAHDELVAEGLLGLTVAARRFDPERGVRLSTYASWWIRASLQRYTLTNRRMVRPPSSRRGRRLLANLRITERNLTAALGEPPPPALLADRLDVSPWEIEEMEAALSGRDVPCATPDERSVDLPGTEPSPEALVTDAESRSRSSEALVYASAALSPRELHVIQQRSAGEAAVSLASVGRGLGISRERVRQIERQAHAKMRDALALRVA